MASVRSPEQRDETTIDIGVALAIFAGLVVTGATLILVAVAAGLGGDGAEPLMAMLVLAAAVASGRHLVRRDRA